MLSLRMQELLQLPWQIQIVIVSGYLGYRVAYAGRTSAHNTTDVFAIVLCFGGVALLSFKVIISFGEGVWYQTVGSVSAVGFALITAAIWRRFVRDWCASAVRWLSHSQDDGHSTAWETIIQQQGLTYSQINVRLTSGEIYESYPLGQFNNEPNGPCVFGGDGSVGLFVTHITDLNDERRVTELLKTEEGLRMTYIPVGSIIEVDFRRSSGV